MKQAGFTGLGLAGATMVGSRLGLMDKLPGAAAIGLASSGVEAAAITDIDILNFALNLEYLEAEFYTVATTGKRISDFGIGITGMGTPGPTHGGNGIDFSTIEDGPDADGAGDLDTREFSRKLRAIAQEITYDEQQHVILLRAALGANAIAKPAINLNALGIGFKNFQEFLVLARAFEDTGVSAYGGAAPLITSKDYLSAGVRIGLTEAMHAANLRLLVAENYVKTAALDSKDVLPPPSGTKYFTVDTHALAVVRTPSQVLSIVFHNSAPGTYEGGFFPNGVNGQIRTV